MYDDLWALDTDGSGLAALEQEAGKAGVERLSAQEEEDPLESSLALSFLLPHTVEAAPSRVADAEYDDVEARAADANEITCWLQHLGLGEHAYLRT